MRVVLLRVGTDSGCRPVNANGPIFPDGRFEYVPLPDIRSLHEKRTYGNTFGRMERPLADYFPERRKSIAGVAIHFDPEFDTFTYGTPTRMQRSLASLEAGDYLLFYGGLRQVTDDGGPIPRTPHALYLFGYFRVDHAVRAREYHRDELLPTFGANFHVRHPDIFVHDHEELVLVKGGPESRLLERAVPISDRRPNRRGRATFVLSEPMAEIFGPLSGGGFIERCSPRWISGTFVDSAVSFVSALM